MSNQVSNRDDDNTIVLHARPIALTKRISILRGPGGIPILREVIIIETEASLSRIVSILLTGFIYALILQIFLFVWQRYHRKSCEIVISTLMFVFPALMLFYIGDKISCSICIVFILFLLKMYISTLRKPMRKETPKNTYLMFKYVHRTAYIWSIFGQILILIGFFLSKKLILAVGLTILGFCIYFGLLLRESMDFIFEKMAINMGYYSKDGAPNKQISDGVCAICDELTSNEVVKLSCGHSFHKSCLMGWIFMGKKSFCMICRENVDFSRLDLDTWQKAENFFSRMIDILRSGIVFIAFFFALGILLKYKK